MSSSSIEELNSQLHKELVAHYIVRSCLNCENFDKRKEQCDLAPGQRPPAEILVYGCIKWEMLIPF